MAEPASEDLDRVLRDSGFRKDGSDPYYYRIEDGKMEKRYTDGDYSQSSENGYRYEKHQSGNEY